MPAETDAGLAALQKGDTAEAISLLEQAAQLYPNDYDTVSYLGGAYSMAGRSDDATRVLTQAVTLQPSNAKARYNLGVALERAGWKPQALEAMQQALQLQPDYPQAQQTLIRLQHELAPAPAVGAPPSLPQSTDYASQAGYAPPMQPAPGYAPQQPQPGYGQPPAYGQPSPQQPMYPPPTGTPPQYGSPYPLPSVHGSYPTPPTGYDTPNITKGLVVGLILAIVLGVGYGMISAAYGSRILFLHLGVGWVIGACVKAASGMASQQGGVLAALFTLLSIGIGVGIMLMTGALFGWFTIIITVIAMSVAYGAAANG